MNINENMNNIINNINNTNVFIKTLNLKYDEYRYQQDLNYILKK